MQDQKPKRTFRAAAGLLAYAALSLLLSQLWRLFPAAARQELPQRFSHHHCVDGRRRRCYARPRKKAVLL